MKKKNKTASKRKVRGHPIQLPFLFGILVLIFGILCLFQAALIPQEVEHTPNTNNNMRQPLLHDPQQHVQLRQHDPRHDPQHERLKKQHDPHKQQRQDHDKNTITKHTNNNNNNVNNNNNPYHHDKDKIMDMLRNMNVDPYSIDNETWAEVPTWSQVQQIWGTEPQIYGVQGKFCESFQSSIEGFRRHIAVGGVFSTGTNLLAQLLQHNCGILERVQKYGRRMGHGMEWQVPWGKHNPYRYRGKHYVNDFLQNRKNPKLEDYLPAVTIRDPYAWMTSMCRHPYTVRWPHLPKNCPNLVKNGKPNNVSAAFGADKTQRIRWDSLAHMWNGWYGEYYNETEHPLVMVRFEDLIFYPKEVTKQVCECAGGELMKPHQVYSDHDHAGTESDFHYVVGSSLVGPGHGRKNPRHGLLDAWIKYSKPRTARTSTFSKSDFNFAEQHLDKRMTQFFGYD